MVYLADAGKCFWCGIPVFYRDVQIDHVFPEDLLERTEDLEKIRWDYGLGADYEINGFENWVTCHQGCNLRKRNEVLPNAPQTLFVVSNLKGRAPKLHSESTRLVSKKRTKEILGQLASALTSGSLTREDVLELIADPPQVPVASGGHDATIPLSDDFALLVPNSPAASASSQGWKLQSVTGNVAFVHNGRVGGMIPNVAHPHPSWQCSRCGSYGPWDGIICREVMAELLFFICVIPFIVLYGATIMRQELTAEWRRLYEEICDGRSAFDSHSLWTRLEGRIRLWLRPQLAGTQATLSRAESFTREQPNRAANATTVGDGIGDVPRTGQADQSTPPSTAPQPYLIFPGAAAMRSATSHPTQWDESQWID